jgi:hypothetical protein
MFVRIARESIWFSRLLRVSEVKSQHMSESSLILGSCTAIRDR